MQTIYDRSITAFYENGKKITLWALAIPKFFELISTALIGTINTAVFSNYAPRFVSAVNVSAQMINIVTILISVLTSGAITLISIELGRGNRDKSAEYSGTAAISVFFVFIFIGLACGLFAEPLSKLMNVKDELLILTASYFRVRMYFIVFDALRSIVVCLLICSGYALLSFFVIAFDSLSSALFVYCILRFNVCFFSLSIIETVAAVNVISIFISLLIGVLILIKVKCPFKFSFNKECLKKITVIGIPGAAGGLFYNISQTITTAMIAFMGDFVLQEKVYYTSILTYIFSLSYAIGYANSILIGRYKGSEKYDVINKLYYQNIRLTVFINIAISICFYIFRRNLLRIFTNDEAIISLAGIVFMIDIFVEAARAVNNVSDNAFRAVGDVKTPFVIATSACFGITVLFTYILGIKLNMGIVGCWTAFALDECFKSVCYLIIWKKEKWKGIKL